MEMQAGERPFTYSWLLILIVLVSWMELDDYQGMDVKAIEVCKGARYHNLWWVREVERLTDCSIQFWIYWEALQEAVVKFPRLSEESMTKYQRILWFVIGPHAIHVQAIWDPYKKWLSTLYKLFDTKLEVMVND